LVTRHPTDIATRDGASSTGQQVAAAETAALEDAHEKFSREVGRSVLQDIESRLARLEGREWWLWWSAIAINLLLVGAVILLAGILESRSGTPPLLGDSRTPLYGLAGVVLLFNLYVIHQELLVKDLNRDLREQLRTNVRAESRAQALENLAAVDPLTGLYNRRVADERLRAEVTRSGRHGHPLAVMFFDLDGFKQINDTFGHSAGDLVLKEFSTRLRESLRVSDVAARVGVDEFLAMLPECRAGQVEHVLTRLEGLEVDFQGRKIPFGVSAGWADYRSGESVQSFLERADQSLYADKRRRKARAPSGDGAAVP
jgi:diguanylate cyclase (GGDEF)-like protein